MTLTLSIPLFVALVGLALFFLAKESRCARVGEILFFVGAFWALGTLSGGSARLGH